MQRLLSTYLFVSRKLTRELLGQIAEAGFSGVEIFCSRAHFDYTSKTDAREIAQVLADLRLTLASVHAPTSRDLSATRESGQPLSICERSEEHTSELQSPCNLVCRLLLEKKKKPSLS